MNESRRGWFPQIAAIAVLACASLLQAGVAPASTKPFPVSSPQAGRVILGGQVVALERHVPVLPPGEGVVHLLVQLEDEAPAGALLELERNGFTARAAGPRGTWFVAVPRERVAEILDLSWVKGVAVPPPATKIAAPLRARLTAGGPGGEAPAVSVLFYKGVSSQVARATLAPYLRGALPEFVAGTSRMNVALFPTVLEALAEEDAVFQIWPILPPLQTDNENSRRT